MADGRRVVLITGAAVFTAIVVAAVLVLRAEAGPAAPAGPAATTVVRQFVDAVALGDLARAARLTDDEHAAEDVLRRARNGMAGAAYSATVDAAAPTDATETTVGVTVTWTLPGSATWRYPATVPLFRAGDSWRVRWSARVLHPGLDATAAPALRALPAGGGLLDRAGRPVAGWTATPQVVLDIVRAEDLHPGTDGWRISAVDGAGTVTGVVAEQAPVPAPALVTTLDGRIQDAADAAVRSESRAAMIVAIQPSTGELLAVARNRAVTGPGPLSGQYPPGSTFKIVTAAAALSAGLAVPESPLPCPSRVQVAGRTISNDGFGYPSLPLRTAFARSCNTTFAELGSRLEAGDLTRTAAQLGIEGGTFELPGAIADLGDVPPPESPAEQVEDSFGQGRVLVTPLAMARAAAIVASGRAVTPVLLRGHAMSVEPVDPPDAGVLRALRSMMREVVTGGTATALAPLGAVAGKTGTAEYGSGSHGWFVGYRGNLAFAVLVVDGGSSRPAVDATARFLRAL